MDTTQARDTARRVQHGPNGEQVVVVKNHATGERGFCIMNTGKPIFVVPLGIAAAAAGSDAWMRDLTFKCQDCHTLTMAGGSDGTELCPNCYERSGLENEHSDNGHATPVQNCPTCEAAARATAADKQAVGIPA